MEIVLIEKGQIIAMNTNKQVRELVNNKWNKIFMCESWEFEVDISIKVRISK